MERVGNPGRWAHRVIVTRPKDSEEEEEDVGKVLGYGPNEPLRGFRERRFRSASTSSVVTTTKTHFGNGAGCNRPYSLSYGGDIDKLPCRLSSTPTLTSSLPHACSTSSSRPNDHKVIFDISDDTLTTVDEKRHRKHGHAQTRVRSHSLLKNRSTIIRANTNELINQGSSQKGATEADNSERESGVVRLTTASLQAAQSQYKRSTSRRRVRRKSIGSRSFLSDDTNTVSSGYGSLSTVVADNEKANDHGVKDGSKLHGHNGTEPLQLLKRRNSFSASESSKSRAEYLKAFNDTIRLRNARRVARDRRQGSGLPTVSRSQSESTAGAGRWRKLRIAVQSAPVRGRAGPKMDNGASDSWEDFIELGMQPDEFIDVDKSSSSTTGAPQQSPRSISTITSSREHERILNELKFSGNPNYSKDGAIKKSIMVVARGVKSININKSDKSSRSSPRSKDITKAPDVEVVIEEEEDATMEENIDTVLYDNDGKVIKGIRSRGWRIVKARLTEIAEKAPKNGIDSTPMTFRNIAQLVKAKQFRMMLKRRASFMENGRFQFDEAKQDLYSRYKVDPVLVGKLTHTPRGEAHGGVSHGDSAPKH